MIRNLKKYGIGKDDLLDVYEKQCRSVLELAVPVWNAGISVAEEKQLESIQKTAFAIILGKSYSSYRCVLSELRMETLNNRRSQIRFAFATKARKMENLRTGLKWVTSLMNQPLPQCHLELKDTKTRHFHIWLNYWTQFCETTRNWWTFTLTNC